MGIPNAWGPEILPCLICASIDTIKAHLIPRAFAVEVTQHGEKHVLFSKGEDDYVTTNTGAYDPNILCPICDGILGSYEGKVYQTLKKLREGNSGKSILVVSWTSMDEAAADTDIFLRFSAGIIWKYASRTLGDQLPLGPYRDILENIAFHRTPIPASVDLCVAMIAHDDARVYFYREPYPVRIQGTNGVSFSVGRFIFYMKLDKRKNPEFFGKRFWMRDKPFFSFPIHTPELFKEHREIIEAETRPRIGGYIGRIRKKHS